MLSGSQVHDFKMAGDVLSGIDISGSNILGDKAYGTEKSDRILPNIIKYTIPPKANNPDPWFCDFWIYKERHLVECFFNKIKAFCRVDTRYDRLVSSFLAFVYVAPSWLLSN